MGRAEDLLQKLERRRAEREAKGLGAGYSEGPDHALFQEVNALVCELVGAHLLCMGANTVNRFPKTRYELVLPPQIRVKLNASDSYVMRKSPLWKDESEHDQDAEVL